MYNLRSMHFQRISVLGLGYIGLPTASILASRGLAVCGMDSNPQVLERLQSGELHIHEPGLRELVNQAVGSGKLTFSAVPQPADAFIIAVPTPFGEGKEADLSFVESAARSLRGVLQRGNLVVLESTSPPRTTVDVVRPILEEGGLRAGEDFLLAYSPERVLPGQILRELVHNARVIGGIDPASAEAGRDLYAHFVEGQILLTDATTAEMVKLMENTYRDISIAAANEFSRLAERFGVDVWEAIRLANHHPRINILNPGPGVGGHCISVDPWFFVTAAPDLTTLIRCAREVNDTQPDFVLARLREELGDLRGRRLALLGLAYKADTDDLRESPAVEIARRLAAEGAIVRACEPYRPAAVIGGVQVTGDAQEALEEAEALVLLVGHEQFRAWQPEVVGRQTPARLALDCVNGWDRLAWEVSGFRLLRLGDGKNRT